MNGVLNIHGTGLVLGTAGVLLRGPSGAGKSVLALSLIERWQVRGLEALLVADDRVDLAPRDGGLEMRPPAALAGLIELRGRGIVRRPFAESAPLHLVVDLVATLERMPEQEAFTTGIAGVVLARCPVPQAGTVPLGHQLLLVIEALRVLGIET